MKKEEKKVFWGFLPFDYRVSESLFSRVAGKGWFVKSVSPYIAVFEADEPKTRRYYARIYAKEDLGEKSRAKYLEQMNKEGLRPACDYDRYFWFFTEGEDAREIPDTAPSDEKRLFGSAVWRKEIYALILLVLAAGFGAVKLYNPSYTSFITFPSFQDLSCFPYFCR